MALPTLPQGPLQVLHRVPKPKLIRGLLPPLYLYSLLSRTLGRWPDAPCGWFQKFTSPVAPWAISPSIPWRCLVILCCRVHCKSCMHRNLAYPAPQLSASSLMICIAQSIRRLLSLSPWKCLKLTSLGTPGQWVKRDNQQPIPKCPGGLRRQRDPPLSVSPHPIPEKDSLWLSKITSLTKTVLSENKLHKMKLKIN